MWIPRLFLAITGLALPALGQQSGGVPLYDPSIVGWATRLVEFQQGPNVEEQFSYPELALGPAEGNIMDIVSLGDGGSIVLGFEGWIANGDGWDFAVFENSFGDLFLELAYVEVSQDGQDWRRFPNESLTPNPVPAFGLLKSDDVTGLAGKYRAGFGTPFDLDDVGLEYAQYVRVIDVIGDGRDKDSYGNPIYDPHPTLGSAGFDLDAVAVRYFRIPDGFVSLWTSVEDGQLILTWTAEPGFTYDLESATDAMSWQAEATITASSAEVIHALPLPAEARFYRVRRK